MYLRHAIRKEDGKVHRYWRLVRSVRVGRRVIRQTVAHLGELDVRFILPKAGVLSLEELDRLCSAVIAEGVRKLRLCLNRSE
jgi:hypothetical protein